MDRRSAARVSAWFSAVFIVAGCGDASAPGSIDPGGVHGADTGNRDAAAPDSGPDAPSGPALQAYCNPPDMFCGGHCIAVGSDPSNCGACGNACIGADSLCLAGSCACSGPEMDYCDGVGCMDVSSDFNNCGSCGYMCDPNNDQACANGQCIPNDP